MDHQQAIATQAAERYLLDELDDADRDAFEAHYFACTVCADDVRTGAQLQDGVRGGLLDSATREAADVIPIGSRRRWTTAVLAPWAVAASLAVVAGYQALWVVPGLRDASLNPVAAVPVLLKPASRGAVSTVTLSGTGVIAFSLDLNNVAEAGAPLSYDLRTIDGQSVATGAVPAPPAGTPLLLVVPVTRLASAGAYTLVVSRSSGNEPVAEYRFAVARP
jgi:anti-sigma factor RsiW